MLFDQKGVIYKPVSHSKGNLLGKLSVNLSVQIMIKEDCNYMRAKAYAYHE